jgi:uncharacterized protein (DUF2062 family)
MTDMSTLMLVCAVMASLALGVLVAYGICQGLFRIFRLHAESAARERAQGSGAGSVLVQG